jgi:hypothetical protein
MQTPFDEALSDPTQNHFAEELAELRKDIVKLCAGGDRLLSVLKFIRDDADFIDSEEEQRIHKAIDAALERQKHE